MNARSSKVLWFLLLKLNAQTKELRKKWFTLVHSSQRGGGRVLRRQAMVRKQKDHKSFAHRSRDSGERKGGREGEGERGSGWAGL